MYAIRSYYAQTLNDDRYLQYSQLHKIYPTPKGPLTVVDGFDP